MRSKKPILICFVGIDGSGKTSLAQELALSLKSRGSRSKYVYNRFRPVALRPIIWMGKIFVLHRRNMPKDYEEYSDTKRKLFRNGLISFCYRYFLLIEYVVQITFRVRIPLMLGQDVVCDRYIHDSIITDLAVDMDYSNERITNMIQRWSGLLPQPNLIFLVDVSEEIAYYRKDDTPSLNYLRERRHLYLATGREQNMTILDGSMELERLEHIVEKIVLRMLQPSAASEGITNN